MSLLNDMLKDLSKRAGPRTDIMPSYFVKAAPDMKLRYALCLLLGIGILSSSFFIQRHTIGWTDWLRDFHHKSAVDEVISPISEDIIQYGNLEPKDTLVDTDRAGLLVSYVLPIILPVTTTTRPTDPPVKLSVLDDVNVGVPSEDMWDPDEENVVADQDDFVSKAMLKHHGVGLSPPSLEEEVGSPDLVITPSTENEMQWKSTHLNQVFKDLDQGNEHAAVSELETILAKYPEFSEAREHLAKIYLLQNNLLEAKNTVEEGLLYDADNMALSTLKARILVGEGLYRDSLELLEQFHPHLRDDPGFYELLAMTLQTLGRSERAGSVYQSLIKLDPKNAQYWLGLGISLEGKHATAKAIQAYQRVGQCENAENSVRTYAADRLRTLKG